MSVKSKMGIVAVLLAIPAFLLGRVIWPDPVVDAIVPTAGQLPFYIFLSALESVMFGFGVSFLIFGWPHIRKMTANRKEATLLLVAIAWLLVSWWPHDNMHRANGHETLGLLYIEFEFHVTLMLAGLIIARHFWKTHCLAVTQASANIENQ